jgi:uncharacterized protein
MTLIETPASYKPSRVHYVFYGPRELRAGWRLLLFVGIVAALIPLGNLLARAIIGDVGGLTLQFAKKTVNITVFIAASWIMGKLERRTLSDYGLPWRQTFRARFWQGALIGFAGMSVLLGSMFALGFYHATDIALRGAAIWKWAGIYAVAFTIVGLEEEFRFRGYLLFTLSSGIGFWMSATLISALFGASHLSNSGETWVGAGNAALGGLVFAGLLRRSGSLWLTIGLHAGWDWAESFFYGVADSGQTVPGNLLRSDFSGPALLTGGSAGPEGSLLCTLVLAVIWLIASWWIRPRGNGGVSKVSNDQ